MRADYPINFLIFISRLWIPAPRFQPCACGLRKNVIPLANSIWEPTCALLLAQATTIDYD